MDDTRKISEETIQLERGIEQLNAGDTSVRGELLNIACQRLMRLTSRIRRDFRGLDGGESTEDVFHNASSRLYQALHDTPIKDARHFYRMAAVQIRRELIELCRYYQDRDDDSAGRSRSDDTSTHQAYPEKISSEELRHWARFHDSIDVLPETQREVFELIWYHEMTRGEAAELLGLPLQQVRRLWRSARLSLHALLGDEDLPTISAGD